MPKSATLPRLFEFRPTVFFLFKFLLDPPPITIGSGATIALYKMSSGSLKHYFHSFSLPRRSLLPILVMGFGVLANPLPTLALTGELQPQPTKATAQQTTFGASGSKRLLSDSRYSRT